MAVIQDLQNLSAGLESSRQATGSFDTYKFGYLGEINQMHRTDYPLILLTPPTSRSENIFKGDQLWNCKFYCYKQFSDQQDGQQNTGPVLPPNYTLENAFDDLEDRFTTLMEHFHLNNKYKWMLEPTWDIERVSHEFNDELVGIEVTCGIRAFRRCIELEVNDTTQYPPAGYGGG